MAEKFDRKFKPHPEYRFWLYDPEGDGLTFWRTAEDRDLFAVQVIDGYLDECWAEETDRICAGEVTHIAQVKNKVMRPPEDELDEDHYDHEGNCWPPEMAWRGNYTLEPVGVTSGEQPQWKPVGLMPQDGTRFWGYRSSDGAQGVAYRIPRSDCEMWCFNGSSGDVAIHPRLKPTHGMPLPLPPEAGKVGACR